MLQRRSSSQSNKNKNSNTEISSVSFQVRDSNRPIIPFVNLRNIPRQWFPVVPPGRFSRWNIHQPWFLFWPCSSCASHECRWPIHREYGWHDVDAKRRDKDSNAMFRFFSYSSIDMFDLSQRYFAITIDINNTIELYRYQRLLSRTRIHSNLPLRKYRIDRDPMLNRTLNTKKEREDLCLFLSHLVLPWRISFAIFRNPWTLVLISFSIKSLGSSRKRWDRCRTIDALGLTWDSADHDRLSNRSDPRWISPRRHECSDRFRCYQHWRQLLDNDWCYRWWQSCFPTSVLERAIRSEWRDNLPMLMSSYDIARQPRREIDRDQHYESEREMLFYQTISIRGNTCLDSMVVLAFVLSRAPRSERKWFPFFSHLNWGNRECSHLTNIWVSFRIDQN